ncbi:hypothetical protein MPL3356_340190 [Mesorhizobium plurifarium]|uniref:Uncharacterized protein n=1 Tax=Mesorhizobium plurifarium TaxID=69974 RepID=A0A090DVU3_MESPL|nr:hypothetical protein MPL3356_340190 [Mesorhizobium plurifarium]
MRHNPILPAVAFFTTVVDAKFLAFQAQECKYCSIKLCNVSLLCDGYGQGIFNNYKRNLIFVTFWR